MLRYKLSLIILYLVMIPLHAEPISQKMPEDFVKISDIDSTIIQSHRYALPHNFLGRPVPGYTQHGFCATKALAEALKKVNAEAKKLGYQLVVYDAYRPQRSVNAFIAWVRDKEDILMKEFYYPNLAKPEIVQQGYVLAKSAHSRGSTVDLTLIPVNQTIKPLVASKRTLSNGEVIPYLDDNTVDMGSSFDLFHTVSNHDSPYVTAVQTKMREMLRSLMKTHGFEEMHEEWWHYTLHDEPYPHTYFDFICE